MRVVVNVLATLFFLAIALFSSLLILVAILDPETPRDIETQGMRFWALPFSCLVIDIAAIFTVRHFYRRMKLEK